MADPKNAGKARSQSQLARDRRLIGQYYLDGYEQAEIADKLNLSRATVSRDLKVIAKQWEKESGIDVGIRREQELARLRRIEGELWAAHELSKANARKKAEEKAKESPNYSPEKKQPEIFYEIPVRYLDRLAKLSGRRERMLGLAAPKKLDLGGTLNLNRVELTPEERKAALESIFGNSSGGANNDSRT